VLLDALWRERKVRFEYRRELCEAAERVVDPLGLVAKGSVWYLVATVDSERRTYRVSRIRDTAVLDQPCTRPRDFDLAAYWEESTTEFRAKLPRFYATFLVGPAAMRWVRYRGWRVEEETTEGDCVRVRMRFDAEEEALQFALTFGGNIELLEPHELRTKVLEGALAMVHKYRS